MQFTILTVRNEHTMQKDLKNITRTLEMKRTNLIKLLLPFTVMLLLFSVACDYSGITAPEAPITASVLSADEINWVSWKPEIVERIRASKHSSLLKGVRCDEDQDTDGYDCRVIKRKEGGTVGNNKLTLGNKVKIPIKALQKNDKKAEISVELIFDDDDDDNYNGEVEFRVNDDHYTFDKDVKITLSYKYLDLDDDFDPTGLKIWWYEDNEEEGEWISLENLEFNTNRKTVSFWVDHFTRYGWAF